MAILNVFFVNAFCQIDGRHVDVLSKKLKNKFSLILKEVNSDKYLISYNENKMMTPASIVKVLTTGAALKELSPEYSFKTTVYTCGQIKNHSLLGDLIIYGGGDPTIESHYFEDRKDMFIKTLLSALKKHNIDTIKGNIIVDASRYGRNGVCTYWGSDDTGNYYGVGAYGFNLYDNYFDLYSIVKNGKVVLLNGIDYDWVTFDNKLVVNKKNYNADVAFSSPMVDKITLRGSIRKSDTVNLKPAVPNPARYAVNYIKKYLSKHIFISGKNLFYYDNAYLKGKVKTKLCEYYSPKLKYIAKITNHVSHNMFAEVLSREVDFIKSGKGKIDYTKPVSVVSFWNTKIKSGKNNLMLDDASGLSRTDKLTAATMCRAIDFLVKDKAVGNIFLETLPMTCRVEEKFNTVRKLKTSSSYVARLKSGSMKGVKSYAGIIDYKNKRYVVVFISNGVGGGAESSYFVDFLNKTFK